MITNDLLQIRKLLVLINNIDIKCRLVLIKTEKCPLPMNHSVFCKIPGENTAKIYAIKSLEQLSSKPIKK